MGEGIAVVTLTRDRNGNLENLARGLARSDLAPAEFVVAHMGGEDPRPALDAAPDTRVVPVAGERMPLAAARNAAIRSTSQPLVCSLDVDCVPAPGALGALARRLRERDELVQALVRYLPAGADARDEAAMELLAEPNTAREALFASASDPAAPSPGHRHFWSTCFAVRREAFERIGGFDEGYVGYGIEDTDFGMRAEAAGVPLGWAAEAVVRHQHHPETPFAASRLDGLIANARRFHRAWGFWPAEGWLSKLAQEGTIAWSPEGSSLERAHSPS